MLDIGYYTKVYSDIRYNVGLCALQSDIGRSHIRLSPISLITDIGLSAHLWKCVVLCTAWQHPQSDILLPLVKFVRKLSSILLTCCIVINENCQQKHFLFKSTDLIIIFLQKRQRFNDLTIISWIIITTLRFFVTIFVNDSE